MNTKTIEKVCAAPAIALHKSVRFVGKIGKREFDLANFRRTHEYWNNLGPGLITGAADDDPAGITTYSQTGARYGFQLLWLAGFTFPLMAIVQEMCARIGLMTGRGLAGNIRINYPRRVLYTCGILLFIANTFNIGADIGAMAKAIELIIPGSNFVLLAILITLFSLLLQIYTSYEQYAKYLKYLALVLLAYVVSAFLTNIDIRELITHTLIPSLTFSKDQLFLITAILGTTISPYLFFWQTSQEVEEEILKGKTSLRLRQGTTKEDINKMRVDSWSGMFFSNAIMYFIIAACATTLYKHGINNIETAADAAKALQPIAGNNASLLFALGIVGVGLLAVPVLAGSAAYTIAESFGWRSGLYRKLHQAPAFYGVIIFSMLIGLLINFIGIDPIKMLIYSGVVNGLVAPVILVLIVQMSGSRRVMKDFPNHPMITALGWFITIIMVISGITTIAALLL